MTKSLTLKMTNNPLVLISILICTAAIIQCASAGKLIRDYREVSTASMNNNGITSPSSISSLLSAEQLVRLTGKLFGENSPAGRSSGLKLLYRASRDGFTLESFNAACRNKGPTVTIAKVGKALFGGYTSMSWKTSEKSTFVYDDKAILFSITSPEGEERFTLHNILQPKYGIGHFNTGPRFGRIPDLLIRADAGKESVSVFGKSFECELEYCETYLSGSINFVVDDYEVYSV